jgi:hypothetical protein
MSSFRRTLTVTRRAAGSYDQSTDVGFFTTEGEDVTLSIKASVQNINGSDMKLLPENRREEEILKLYTSTELAGAIKGSGANADIVAIDGSNYEVIKTLPWKNGVINHYKVFVAKLTTNDAD